MKKLIINGETWFYKQNFTDDEYSVICYSTNFYRQPFKEVVKTKYKYLFFGEKTSYTVTEEKDFDEADFIVKIDIESEFYTKNDVRLAIERAMELMNRKKEIENGEII